MSHKPTTLRYAHGETRDRVDLAPRWILLTCVTAACVLAVIPYWIRVEHFMGQAESVRHWLRFGLPLLCAGAVCLVLVKDAIVAYLRLPRAGAHVWLGIAAGLVANASMTTLIGVAFHDFVRQVSDPRYY